MRPTIFLPADVKREYAYGRIGRTTKKEMAMSPRRNPWIGLLALFAALLLGVAAPALAQTPGKQPNIVMIMGDDIGWANIGAYNQGLMSMRTPNLDRLAAEGMRFTDYWKGLKSWDYAQEAFTGWAQAFRAYLDKTQAP